MEKPLVIYSTQDVAGLNITDNLRSMGFDNIYESPEKPFAVKELPENKYGYIVASKHVSQAGKPTFCAHSLGNLNDDNTHGGDKYTVGICNANGLKTGLRALFEHGKKFEYHKTLETTHHGPTHLKKPIIFMEVGGTEKEWNNKSACLVVAEAILDIINSKEKYDSYIGFGGGHYPIKFTQFVLEKQGSIGHICPKYKVNHLTEDIVTQMFEKTFPSPVEALIDKKSLKSAQIKKVIDILDSLGKAYKLI